MNKAFVEAFKKANHGMRPNFMAVGGYDGMHLIYEALKKTGGKADGDTLIDAMKGMTWESPRGPISIDPETRDIIQNVYIRKVEKKNGQLYNVEFATFANVKDPVKARRSNRPTSTRGRRTSAARTRSQDGSIDRRDRFAASPQSGRGDVGDHADDPVRRPRLRHAAVRAGVRAVGDARVDEFHQPGAWRVRHGRRLCHRHAGQRLGCRSALGLPVAFLPRRRSARCSSARSTCASTPEPSRPGAVHHRAGLHVDGGGRLFHGPSSRSCRSRKRCRARFDVLGIGIGQLPAVVIVVCGAAHGRAATRPDEDPLRQPLARRGRRSRVARGLGINVDAVFALTFAFGSGLAGLGGALGSEILGLDPTFPLKFMIYFLIVVTVGGTSSITGPFLASILLGIGDVAGKYYVPKLGAFVIYIIMIVVLIWRPQGLFARRRR